MLDNRDDSFIPVIFCKGGLSFMLFMLQFADPPKEDDKEESEDEEEGE